MSNSTQCCHEQIQKAEDEGDHISWETEQQETSGKIPDKTEKLPTPSVVQRDAIVPDDGIQERTVPVARTPQIVVGTDVLPELQRQVCVETTERTSMAEKSAATPPYMHVTIEDVLVRCGEMAKFEAIIEGNPQPTVAWFKGISLLTDSERVRRFSEDVRYSLILYKTRPEDGGVYTCMAKNARGEVVCKAELVVQEDKKSQEAKKQSTRRKLHSFYEVKQEIARGSFGFLKKVVHKDNRTLCAAKFIPLRSKTRDQAYRERDILATLSHDRITRLLDEFETRKTLILILELCSNEELLDRLFRKNVVTEAEVKLYIRQLLEGIAYIHENKILHLDIKPSNILMVYDDRDDIKICDFGFAQKINLTEPQYSKYGSPEFVSPEILSQSPVSMASDIWPVGVISYLSLTCKSPFAGENDRATLLNIHNGTISWDIPDFVCLSADGKDFIRKILQHSAKARPSAKDCLSHRWFVENIPHEEAHFIDTKQLKFFVSRSKWQRSLMSYKSVLVMRPIPDILEKTQKNTSLGISRNLVEDSSSTSSSGSSSDNEFSAPPGKRHFGPVPELHLSVLDGSNYPEFPQHPAETKYPEASLLPALKPPIHKPVMGELGDKRLHGSEEPVISSFVQEVEGICPERKEVQRGHSLEKGDKRALQPEAGSAEVFHPPSPQEKDSLLLPEEGKKAEVGRSPGCVPRHSVIKSTFYSQPSESLANVPSSPGKEHQKHLERAKRTYRKAGYSKSSLSGLREPLLEQFQLGEGGGGLSGEEETGRCREGGIGPLTKSASFDSAQKSPRVTFEVSTRSRSLDDYRIRAASFAEEQYIEEEDSELIPQGSPTEAARQPHLSEGGFGKTSAKDSSKITTKEQPVLLAQRGGKQSSVVDVQQQEKAAISTQQPGKEESSLEKPKPPLSTKMGTAVLGGEGMILTTEPSDSPLASAEKKASEEQLQQTSKESVFRGAVPVSFKGESSQSETAPLVSHDAEGARHLPHEAKPTSLQGSQRTGVLQGESHDFVKPAPGLGTIRSGDVLPQMPSVQGELQKVVTVRRKSPEVEQTDPVGDTRSLFQPVAQEGRTSDIPILQAGTSALSALEGKDQKILPRKQLAPGLSKTAVLEGKGPVSLTISQAEPMPALISESETQKIACQTPTTPGEMKTPVIPWEDLFCIDTPPIWDTDGESQSTLPKKPSDFSEVVSSILSSAISQAEPVPVLISESETQKIAHETPSTHGEMKTPVIPGEDLFCIETPPIWDSDRESQSTLPKKPSDFSEVVSSVLSSTISQAEPMPVLISETQKIAHETPTAHGKMKTPVIPGEDLFCIETPPIWDTDGESQSTLLKKPSDFSEVVSSVLSSAISQAEPVPVLISESETQKIAHETPTTHGEMKTPVIPGEELFCIETPPIWDTDGESQSMLPKKPSGLSEAVSSVLTSAISVTQTASQKEIAPLSLPAGESHKGLPPMSSIHSEAVSVLSEKKSPPQQAEAIQTLIHEDQRHDQLYQKSFVPSERKPEAFEEGRQPLRSVLSPEERQPLRGVLRPGLDLASAGGSQKRGHEEHLIHTEVISTVPKGKSPQVLKASEAKTTPVSSFGAENQELLYSIPSDLSEAKPSVMKGQRPSSSAISQATTVPFSLSESESMGTTKRAPVRSREAVHQKPPVYSEEEAKALESLVDEMVVLSKEMNVLAESVSDQEGATGHISPPREVFYQGPPGQALRPVSRFLVRKGKREGGIGLADPSEADVIYPGEEEYFSRPPFMSKKARMAAPFEGRGLEDIGIEMPAASQFTSSDYGDRFCYYSGSDRSYEIALVQIGDLWDDMPRPDSKTAKFDISEVEPAFLNLYELYDIVYYPFEFFSFRKAPEKLPSKRHLPLGGKARLSPGLEAHFHQDKKLCLQDTMREASREEETAALESVRESDGAKALRKGKRSDSEGDLPTGSQQIYGLPADPTGKRRSSLQSRLGAFKPFVRSQSMELIEQSLKKKMKASVAHLSRMLTRKPSPDQRSREGSEERKGDLRERESLTEASGTLKKKTGFPSFTLPSLKTKEKAPSFVEELTDQTIASGQSVTLSCRTSARSSPHVEWFKDGAAIRSTDRILISSTLKHYQLLTILAARKEDFGTYTCVATNSQGTVSTSCVIRKAEPPSNPPSPDIIEILEDGVQLAWKPVELHTPVTYTVLCRKEDGEWKTLASDISNCCYTARNLPWGLVCSFRIACVSKAGVGPYSNPSAKVKIGEKDQAAFQSSDTEDGKMTAPAQPTHQTYAFQTEIKRGRFSIIKQCREKLSGNALAAKIIPYRADDKELVLQEYQVLRKLHHTHVGQLQGAYVSPRHLVLILELCVGPELLHALAGRSSYSEMEVRDYLWQILTAVEFLHSQNILHLDLRSENMIITEPNLLKLLDFGNAQFYAPDRVITLDGCTDYVETMASELLSDKGAVPQTDIWAVGVTAFIMLSAEYPISSEAACDFGRLVKREKIKLNRCYAGLSGGAVSFLQGTLSSNPWRRPSASECLQSPWLQETGLDERQQATVTFSSTKLRNFVAERERKRALLCSKYGLMTV